MSNVFTLDAIKEEADKEFAPFVIDLGGEEIVLRNLMRINKKDRDLILEQLKVIENNGEEDQSLDNVDVLAGALEIVLSTAADKGMGKRLIQVLDGDLMLGMKIMNMWTEATSVGEAESSPA